MTSYGTVGSRANRPPQAGSRIAANTGGESIAGAAHQSMQPSRETSATDSPSPISAYDSIAANSSARAALCVSSCQVVTADDYPARMFPRLSGLVG